MEIFEGDLENFEVVAKGLGIKSLGLSRTIRNIPCRFWLFLLVVPQTDGAGVDLRESSIVERAEVVTPTRIWAVSTFGGPSEPTPWICREYMGSWLGIM